MASSSFAFAFDERNFSDRVLRIEVMAGSAMTKAVDGSDRARTRKRRRGDAKNDAEEAALMDMLQFIYTGRLQAVSTKPLLEVLMVADKYEVASCMQQCSKLLQNLPMTPDSALRYIVMSSSVLLADEMQPLTDAATSFLVSQYKDILRCQETVMSLPLAGIEALLSSDDLQVPSEDNVYDFVLKWARAKYPKAEERRSIVGSRLVHLIRFPLMSAWKLREVLAFSELDKDVASSTVLEALFYKAESTHRQRQLALEKTRCRKYAERSYIYRPMKFLEFEYPHRQCIVYLDLRKEECVALFPAGRVQSQAFHLGGEGFFLSASCNMDQQSSFHCFGLYLGMQEKGSVSCSVDFEFGSRHKPSKDFVVLYRSSYKFTIATVIGRTNLFSLPWKSFVADDSRYFIDNILHLRAELIMKPE